MFDSLITAGNSFQIVGAVKLKERLLKLVAQNQCYFSCDFSVIVIVKVIIFQVFQLQL